MRSKECFNIAVVGGGVAGKAVLALLREKLRRSKLHRPLNFKITAFMNLSGTSTAINLPTETQYTGLWSTGHRILQIIIGNDALHSLPSKHIAESGYRGHDGRWLLQPSRGMMKFPDAPSLTFFRNDCLHNALDEAVHRSLAQRDDHLGTEFVSTSIQILDHHTTGGELRYTLVDLMGKQHHADVILACDGMNSVIKRIVLPQSPPVSSNNYTVYRGSLSSALSPSQAALVHSSKGVAYQTWGSGGRFAVVPTADGLSWFAAVTDLATRTTPQHTVKVNEADKQRLVQRLQGWHEPVAQIVSATEAQRIVADHAWATSRVDPLCLGEVRSNQQRIYFLGDAAHTLDPILAQGAGIALEDATWVSHAVMSAVTNDKGHGEYITKMQSARLKRLQRLRTLSNISQGLGHIDSSGLVNARDMALHGLLSLPWNRRLAGKLFDNMIALAAKSNVEFEHI